MLQHLRGSILNVVGLRKNGTFANRDSMQYVLIEMRSTISNVEKAVGFLNGIPLFYGESS